MKFIIDAQLPKSLSDFLNAAGFNSLHTLELPEMNRTGDNAITAKADIEGRIVVTKDADFLDSYLLFGKPAKLLLVKTGNIPNSDLLLSLLYPENSRLHCQNISVYFLQIQQQ